MENSKRHPNCNKMKVLLLPSHLLTETAAEREFGLHELEKGGDKTTKVVLCF